MSFFGKLRSNTSAQSSNGQQSSSSKKNPSNSTVSPLERLIANPGPVNADGSDKFFGCYNPNTTCYFNSIIQCLYFSEHFRQQILSYPSWVPRSSETKPNAIPLSVETANGNPPENGTAVSPRLKPQSETLSPTSPTRQPSGLISPSGGSARSEENKESFDYKKKQAIANGPLVQIPDAYSNSYGMKESLFTGLKDLFETIVKQQTRTGVLNPSRFIDFLRTTVAQFRTPVHHDAHEFLMILLNDVKDQVEEFSKQKRSRNGHAAASLEPISEPDSDSKGVTSWVHELFGGLLTSEIRCLTCESISQSDEPFLDLSLDLEENSSLSSCLRRFSDEEMLCKSDKFRCDKCGDLQEAEKRMKIKILPKILAIHLKRFKYVDMEGRMQKLFHRVVYPFTLRLMHTTDDCEDPDRLYELYAVVVHLGSTPVHGHYVTIIKTKDKGWLLFDDELVLPVSSSYVRNFFGDSKSPAAAYMLFYQQVSEDVIEKGQEVDDPTMGVADEAVSTPIAKREGEVDRQARGLPLSPTEEIAVPAHAHRLAAPAEDAGYTSGDSYTVEPPPSADPFSDTDDDSRPGTAPLPVIPMHNLQNPAQDQHPFTHDSVPEAKDRPLPTRNSTGFGRFKNTSMSFRQKSKLWGGGRERPEIPTSAPAGYVVSKGEDHVIETSEYPPTLRPTKSQKTKGSRFSLGRKKSTILGQ